jgi:hypothetical protein
MHPREQGLTVSLAHRFGGRIDGAESDTSAHGQPIFQGSQSDDESDSEAAYPSKKKARKGSDKTVRRQADNGGFDARKDSYRLAILSAYVKKGVHKLKKGSRDRKHLWPIVIRAAEEW